MTKPDFKTWTKNIILISIENGTAHEEIERALEQAYNQGYSLGLNQGWAIEQDKEYKAYSKGLHGNMCACSMCNGDHK